MSSSSRRKLHRASCPTILLGLTLALTGSTHGQDPRADEERIDDIYGPSILQTDPIRFAVFDRSQRLEAHQLLQETSPLRQVTMLQPTPFADTQVSVSESAASSAAAGSLTAQLQASGLDLSALNQAKLGVETFSVDLVNGQESASLVSTDLGSLLKKAPAALSVEVQSRTPVMNDPRIRGSRIGAASASGSYWVPAREDLDTIVSKIDSRLVNDVIIVPGPYSSVFGPGFSFMDFELLPSPRYADGNEVHGRSAFDHKSNGNQWLGLQSIWAGGENWGVRGNYTHRKGSDYRAGNGTDVASSYESREFTLAFGRDFGNDTSIELSLLRLDQTDVEFPGYVFDIDFLVTDGYEVTYIDSNPNIADRVETEIWYNRTRFEGNAQNPAKRAQFPLLAQIRYLGFTDVDSMSTGYRRARTWGTNDNDDDGRLTIGHDLRFVKQELNEISSGRTLGTPPRPFFGRNSPIPRSFAVNPGLFAEYYELFLEDWTFRTGARVDYVQTDITADRAELDEVGLGRVPASYEEIVGTSISQTDRLMWSLYGALSRQHSDCLVSAASFGYAQRAPTLTALYAAEPFLLLMQNGLNDVTGDPTLKREQMLQADLSVDFGGDNLRAGIRGFYGWVFDYLTFENTGVVRGPVAGPVPLNADVQQVSLRYVNTSLATLAGFESFAELLPEKRLSPFVTMRYVDGRDRTRNGDFATREGRNGSPSTKVSGLPRGSSSGIGGSDSEPLPGISPFETRVGVRLKNAVADPRWNIELAARIVDNQDRVATSLLESPTSGFTVYDLRGTYRPAFMDSLLVVSGVENFTDKNYREHLDFRSPNGISILQPGINFYFGTDLSY